MKQRKNGFLSIVPTALLAALALSAVSCFNLHIDDGAETDDGKAHLSFQIGGTARSVTPENVGVTDIAKFALSGKSSTGNTLNKTWESDGTSAYAKMTADTSLSCEAGRWTFTLTAYKNGAAAFASTITQTINSGKNTLSFTLSALKTGTGSVSIKLSFPSNAQVQAVKAGLFSLDRDAEVAQFKLETLEISQESVQTGAAKRYVTYAKSDVPSGDYTAKFYFYRDATCTQQIQSPYTTLVKVRDGRNSTAELDTDVQHVYAIKYELNGGNWGESVVAPLTSPQTQSFIPPAPERIGCTFTGWSKTKDASTATYAAGVKIPITTDTTLYAVWKTIEYTIMYELNGGTGDSGNPTTFTVESEITINQPTKQGWVFSGWYFDEEFSESAERSAGVYGWSAGKRPADDVTLWAKWDMQVATAVSAIEALASGQTLSVAIGGAITSEDISTLATAIKNTSKNTSCYVSLNLNRTTGLSSIDSNAFVGCSRLASVTIPAGVTSIGFQAFCECSSLENVTIPASVKSIGESAFSGCSSLASATIPEGVTSIGKYAFSECRSLASVTIPAGAKSIGDGAFHNCSNLTSVTLPEGMTSIGQGAFVACRSLVSITIPAGVTNINVQTFLGCSNLKSVTIPEGVTTISEQAFSGCSSLASATFPVSVKSIDQSAFFGCSSLASVTFPEGMTSVGQATFSHCSSLKSVTIPSSVTNIGIYAFSGCSNLTSVTIQNGVPNISNYMFENCYSLSSITIPASVKNIGYQAFKGCPALGTAAFAVKSGWYYQRSGRNASPIPTWSQPSTAAQYLRSTYVDGSWYRQ